MERTKLMFNKKILIIYEYLPPYITGAYNRGEFYLNFFPNYFKENIFIASNFDVLFKRENYSIPEKANIYRILLDSKKRNNCKLKRYFNIIFKKNKLDYYANSKWVNGCLSLIREINYYPDIIFVSFPGYNALKLAIELKKSYFQKSKYVLDLRDPIIGYVTESVKSKVHKWITEKIENDVIRNFDFVISASYYERDRLIKKYKLENIKTITSGYFNDNSTVYKIDNNLNVHIGYFGSFTISDVSRKISSLKNFFSCILKFNNKNITKIKFNFYGNLTRNEINYINKYNFCAYKGILKSNQKLNNAINSQDILTLYNINVYEGILTGKLFEYMAFKKPILVLSPANSEVAKFAKKIGGEYIDPLNCNEEDINKIISLANRKINLNEYEKYSWKCKEKEFFEVLSSMI